MCCVPPPMCPDESSLDLRTAMTEVQTASTNVQPAPSATPRGKSRWLRGLLLAPIGVILGGFWFFVLGPIVGVVMTVLFLGFYFWESSRPKGIAPAGGLWWRVPAALIGHVAIVVVIVAAIQGKPNAPGDGGGEIAASTAGANTTQPVTPPPMRKQEVIEDRVGTRNVERAGNRIHVTFHTGTLWSEKWVAIKAGEALADLGRWAAQDLAGRLPEKQLVLKVHTPTIDQYGKSESRIVMILEVNTPDFAKIDWRSFSGDQILNLTSINLAYPTAGLAAYCQDKSREMFARQFCRQAARFMP